MIVECDEINANCSTSVKERHDKKKNLGKKNPKILSSGAIVCPPIGSFLREKPKNGLDS